MNVCFVDIDALGDHHCLNFLFKIIFFSFTTILSMLGIYPQELYLSL